MIFGWKNNPEWVRLKADQMKERLERLNSLNHQQWFLANTAEIMKQYSNGISEEERVWKIRRLFTLPSIRRMFNFEEYQPDFLWWMRRR